MQIKILTQDKRNKLQEDKERARRGTAEELYTKAQEAELVCPWTQKHITPNHDCFGVHTLHQQLSLSTHRRSIATRYKCTNDPEAGNHLDNKMTVRPESPWTAGLRRHDSKGRKSQCRNI